MSAVIRCGLFHLPPGGRLPTTDASLVLRAVEAITEAGVEYGLLFGREGLGGGSDVDLVVEYPAAETIHKVWRLWLNRGLFPVVVWPYDIGETAAVFLATADASEGVHLDLLHDLNGVGHLGVFSGALLRSVVTDDGPLEVSREASLIYEWRKRLWKRQSDRLPDLRKKASEINRDWVLATSVAVTGSALSGSQLVGELPPPRIWRPNLRHPVAKLVRIIDRVADPVGFWAHVQDPQLARLLADRFSRFLVLAGTGAVPSPALQIPWAVTRVAKVRFRPGIFISHGPSPGGVPRPDLIVQAADQDSAAREITSAMAARLRTW